MKKDDIFDLSVEDIDVDGNGIGHIDGMAVFVHGALPGETVRAKVIKVKKNLAVSVIDSFISKSEGRRNYACPCFKRCGGCSIMHADYNLQLAIKHNRVKSCMQRIGGIDTEVRFPLSAGNEYRYRNKAAFPVGLKDGKVVAGFYKHRSHEICEARDCLLHSVETSGLLAEIKAWISEENIKIYDEIKHKGLLRHIIIRSNSDGEMMLTLVINGDEIPGIKKLVRRVQSDYPNLKSIILSHNRNRGNVILGSGETLVYGPGYLTETIDGLSFRVSAHSFMQVNYKGMCLLYSTLFDLLDLRGNETVVDLYCGVGTISLLASKRAGMVYGIEIVEDAVNSARANASDNNISNAEFFAGDAEKKFEEIRKMAGKIDVVIVDPPRKGLTEKVIEDIVLTDAGKIGYVSCDPATLARDIVLFGEKGYEVKIIQPVDMFPQTTHCEVVCLMSKM